MGNENIIDDLISSEGIEALLYVITKHPKNKMVRTACWCLSNIAVGPSSHIQSLINRDTIKILSELILSSNLHEVMYININITGSKRSCLDFS